MPSAGEYELLTLLGRGGMGEVWSARHRALPVDAAVKLVRGGDPHSLRHEVRAVAALDHPHIVRILDHGELAVAVSAEVPAGTSWYAMPRATDGALGRGPVAWSVARGALLALLDALAHAHARGVLHRDLKPGNVLLTRDRPDRPPHPVLADFGIAHALESGPVRPSSSGGSGTPAYMAPEQLEGDDRALGPWTDLYALGCVAWVLLTGQPPYGRGPVATVLHRHLRGALPPLPPCDAPPGAEEVLRRLLRRHPGERYRCAADAAAALLALPASTGESGAPLSAGPALGELETVIRPGSTPRPPAARAGRAPPPAPFGPRWARPLSPAMGHLVHVAAARSLFGLRRPPPVAREAEREALWALLGRVHRTGSRAAALVTGPTGAGRTHLLAWLVERATELGAARVLVVHPGDDAAALLRRWTRTAGVPDDALAAALADALPPELAPVAQAVCTPGPALGPRERLVAAGRVIAASSDRPVVITVDDAHASLDAAQLLRDLCEVVGPVLVVGSADDTLLVDTPAERAVLEGLPAARVALTRWDRAASAALLRALLPLEGPLEGQLVEAGEGNPGWFVDVVTALVRGDALAPGAAAFRLREGADLGAFRRDPRWEARLDGVLVTLEPAAQQGLEVLAALGPAVDRERWRDTCEALGLPAPGARALAPLREQHLVADAPGEPIRLLHPGLADALRARAVAAGRWAAAHAAAAQTAPDLVDRAIHLVAAGGGRADEVLEALWTGFVACWSTGSRSRSAAIAAAFGDRVARGDVGPRWLAMLEVMRAIHALGGHRPLEAGPLVEGAVAAAEAAGDLRARAWALRCRLRFWRVASRPDEGRAAAEATLAACRELGDAQLEGDVLIELGNLLATTRQLDAAVEVLERARSHPAVQADADAWARAHLSLGAALLNARRHDEALRAYDTALAAFERTGSVWGRAQTLSDRANVWAATGAEPARVRAAHEQAVALFDTIGHPSVAFPSVNLGFLELEAGRPAQARPLLDRAAAVFEGRPAEAPVRAARLRCLAHDGDWAAITQELDAIEEVLARAAVASYGVGAFVEEAARAVAAAGQVELAARLRALPPRFRA